jgi:hypothetical protein
MELNEVWDSRFLRIAEEVSTWSKDPSLWGTTVFHSVSLTTRD